MKTSSLDNTNKNENLQSKNVRKKMRSGNKVSGSVTSSKLCMTKAKATHHNSFHSFTMKSNLLIFRGRIITSHSLIAQCVHLSITMPNNQPSGAAKEIELEVDVVNYNSQEDKKS